MDADEALALLAAAAMETRLRGARALTRNARRADANAIAEALAHESDRWVRRSLTRALSYAQDRRHGPRPTAGLVSEDERADELLSVATASVTGLLLHEFSPLLGDIRRRARSDVPDYETSQTMQAIDRLDRLLEAIRSLNRAASAAKMADLDVSTVVQSLAQECAERGEVRIESSGPRPLLVRGDPGLIEMAVGQGIRNAAESLPAEATFPIQVTWDLVDGTASISVSDRGVGLPKGFDSTLRSIATTKDKREHHGFGLLTANRAVRSMGGRLSVARRDGGGTTFTLEWPAV